MPATVIVAGIFLPARGGRPDVDGELDEASQGVEEGAREAGGAAEGWADGIRRVLRAALTDQSATRWGWRRTWGRTSTCSSRSSAPAFWPFITSGSVAIRSFPWRSLQCSPGLP